MTMPKPKPCPQCSAIPPVEHHPGCMYWIPYLPTPMSTEADIVDTVRAWAKAYRNTPEHRFPSDPHAEFFPVDLDTICNEVVELRAERDAAVLAERERCKKSVRNTICNMSWPPEDGDQLIDDLQAGIALFATSGKDAT